MQCIVSLSRKASDVWYIRFLIVDIALYSFNVANIHTENVFMNIYQVRVYYLGSIYELCCSDIECLYVQPVCYLF